MNVKLHSGNTVGVYGSNMFRMLMAILHLGMLKVFVFVKMCNATYKDVSIYICLCSILISPHNDTFVLFYIK